MKLSHVLRSTFGFMFVLVLLAASPFAAAQDAEEYGEGVPYSPTAPLGASATSVQQISATQTSTTASVADPTHNVAGYLEADLNLPNGPSASGFTIIVKLDVTRGISASSRPLQSIFMINDGANNDTDIAFALLRDYTGYWYIAKRVDGPLSQPLVMYASRLWDPMRSPCVVANSCTFDTMYVTFSTNGSIYLDEYATLANPAAGTSKYSWFEGVSGFGYPVLSYQTGSLGGPSTSPMNFAPARGLYTGGISVNWFNSVGNPAGSGGGTPVGGTPSNPVPFDDNVLNGINAYQASLYDIAYANSGIIGDGTLSGLRSYIVSDQQSYQNTDDPIIVNGIFPCNSGAFETTDPEQQSYSPIFLATPCRWPGGAPLGQVTPSHADFYASSQTQTFTVSNIGQGGSYLQITNVQTEPIDPNLGNNTDNFRITNNACNVNSNLGALQSCTITVQYLPVAGGNFINNNVRLRVYTNADTVAVPLAAPLYGYSDVTVPDNCKTTGYPGCNDPNTPNQTTYTLCAPENGTCNFAGDRNIVFGANGVYTNPVTYTNTVACNDATLGPDPIPNVVKACYMSPAISAWYANSPPVGLPYPIYCADEGQTCSVTEPIQGSLAIISAHGNFIEGSVGWDHTIPCTTSWFASAGVTNGDPAPGFKKACFYKLQEQYFVTHYGPPGYAFCAGEGGTCNFQGLGRIAYGAFTALGGQGDPKFNYQVFNGGVACNDSVLGDPYPNVTKDCYYQPAIAATPIASTGGAGSGGSLACDIYASGGTPCVAAHSTVRALLGSYNGKLYQVTRASDGHTTDILTLAAGGYVSATTQDSFCVSTTCTITKIYDQTSNHNDLTVPGGDSAAVANALPITVNGIEAYGVKVTPGVGYRNNATTAVAKGSSPEGMYMVTSGTYTNGLCCFDYGNAETNSADDGAGRMDALNFGNYCEYGPCNGAGPWVEADLENGQYMGNGNNPNDLSMGYNFVTAMLKNNGTSTFALKGGNADTGGLTTDYSGSLPTNTVGGLTYIPMNKQGAIILGIGGDNSDTDIGAFFEGAMTSGYPTDATENAVQASIVAVQYACASSGCITTSGSTGVSEPPGPYTGPSDPNGAGPQDGFASPATEQPNDAMATKPALASFNGSLYVAFEGINASNDLYVTSSSTGNNFPAATRYTNLQTSSAPALATFNNQLFMAFRGLNVNNDFYVTASSNGSTFPTATQYTNIQMGGAPALAVFNNQLCAAFQAADPGHTLHVTCSSDGVTWPTAWQVGNVAIGSDPAMTVFNGKLYIAFRANDSSNDVWIASSQDGHTFSSQVLAGQTMGGYSTPALVASRNVLYYIYGANDSFNEMLVTASTDGSTWQGPAAYLGVQMGAAGPGATAFGSGVFVGFQSNDSRNVLFVTNKVTGGPVPPEQPQPATTTNPQPGAFMNDATLLGNVNDPNWFLSNIPFLEVPDTAIQQVYYYRWQTYKEHLVYTSPFYGWLSTEFLAPASYGAPYGGINAAAGHQTTEGRWLRDQQYVKDNINYWLNGPGQNSKPQDYDHNPDTADWAHEYSYWAASSAWQTYLATGDVNFATGLLPQLVTQYRGWDNHFNSSLGLYWQYPVWDATEYSPASYESTDPYHGGAGYRPTINSYQYGDAQAIAQIANLAGNSAIASEYTQRATALQTATQQYLWDPARNFFFHMNRDNNPSNALLDTREEEGFVPWMFELPTASDSSAMAELLDPSEFQSAYGPPTAEKRSSWYMYQAAGCCHWDGPSWPYETSQTLTGFANLLIDYPQQQYVDANDYVDLLHTYAATQYKNGSPYVAEAHDPDNNDWIYDTPDHSEDYNHSTYIDNVISGLIGLRGQPNNTLLISPLAPPSWDYFALENTPYHGHNVSVLWDRLGTRYGQGVGLSVFVDNIGVVHQSTLNPVTVNVGSALTQTGDGLYDIAVNSQHTSYGPQPIASYVFSPEDNIFNGIDGIVYRTGIPENSRWTTYLSPNTTDYYGVNFNHNVTIQEARITFYDDGGGTRVPYAYLLQYLNSSGVWTNIGGDQSTPAPNTLTSIKFSPITTTQIRVGAVNTSPTQGWGISELQAMSTSPGVTAVSGGVYQIVNVNSNKMMGVHNEYPFDSAQIQQYQDDGTPDHFWVLEDAGNGYFKLLNLGTNLVLGVSGESTANSAPVVQFEDNGTPDHLWKFIGQNGVFKIQNMNSGLLLGVDQESTANSANIVQFQDNGTPDHLWALNQVTDPRNSVVYKINSFNPVDSGTAAQVLAVQNASLVDSAPIQQYFDTGTPDHLWTLEPQGGASYIKVRNVFSNLVLGLSGESTTEGANIVQFEDNGTPDHIWQYLPQFTSLGPSGSGTASYGTFQNYNSGLVMNVAGASTAPSTNIIQWPLLGSTGSDNELWALTQVTDPRNSPVYKIINGNSGLLLGVQDQSFANSAQIQQYSDSGTTDHIWQLENVGGGHFKIRNLPSNLVLGVSGESTAGSADIVQFEDNGTPDHLWQVIPAGNDQFKIQNVNSGLLLGVSGESTALSADIVQFEDNGTPDHLWTLQATGWPSLYH